MPQIVDPVEPRLSPTPSTSRLRISTVKLSQWTSCNTAAPTSNAPLTVVPAMPHITETLAPMWSEICPAHGRLNSVAMYWMLIARPASTAL